MKIGYMLVGGYCVTGIPSVQYNLLTELQKIDPCIAMDYITNNDFKLPVNNPYRIFSEMKIDNYRLFIESLIKDKYDIIHSFQPPFDHLKNKAKKILSIMDLSPMLFPDWYNGEAGRKLYDINVRKSAEMADAIITISEYTKSDVIKHFNIQPEKIHVVYLGINKKLNIHTESSPQIRKKYSIEGEYILSVCSLMKNKNLSGLIKAYKIFRMNNRDLNIKLVLTGAQSNDEQFRDLIDTLGSLKEDIIITGFVDDSDLQCLYANAIAFAYCSFYEGFGLPILEAMALGKAVICSNTSSMPEVGGDAVEYCNPWDVENMAQSIEKVILDEGYRKLLETKAIRQAAKFSYKKAAEETYAIYKNCLGV